jgi:hypothetical protein
MAKQGQVTLRGRFGPGTHVRLVKVAHEGVLRSEGGELVDTGKVNAQGEVTFKALEVGSRYFVAGYVDGFLLEVRVTAREADDAVTQPAVAPDRVKLADGSFADEAPDEEKAPVGEVAPGPSQQQARGVAQRSATPRGSAHPVDEDESQPYPRQEDVPGNVAQRSSTETGMATPIPADGVPERQEDAPADLWQRSATPHGVTTPIPAGDAVAAQRAKESAEAKVQRGEPGQAAARPPAPAGAAKPRAAARKATGPEKARQTTRQAAGKSPAQKQQAAKRSSRKSK